MTWRAALLLAVLLGGCAAPRDARIQETPLQDAPAPMACDVARCSYEWWNLTLPGPGPHEARAPMPAILPNPGQPWDDPLPWHANLTVNGTGRASLAMGSDAVQVVVRGEGPLEVKSFRIRPAESTGYAEAFLRARWGATADQARPTSIPLVAQGEARLTYEARSELCERHASYHLESAGQPALGRDEVICR